MFLFQVFNFVLSIFNTVCKGFLVKTFWGWFILTQFPSLPQISIMPAIGFCMFVSAISPWRTVTAKEIDEMSELSADKRTMISFLNGFFTFVAIVIMLGMGWVVHHFM